MNELLKKITIEENILIQELNDSIILLNLNTEHYYGLDHVGQRFWRLLTEHHDVQKVYDIMVEEYDVAPELLKADISRLIKELAEAKLISVTSS